MKDEKFYLDCECGCSALSVEHFDEDEDILYFSHYVNAYYEKQLGMHKLKMRLKLLWAILTGKEYQLYEIVLGKDQFERFKEYINNIGE